MLSGISLAFFGVSFHLLGGQPSVPPSVPLVAWQDAKVFDVPTEADPVVEQFISDYLNRLAQFGFKPEQQGVWIQTQWAQLGQNNENIPISAASLTKIATSLATLEKWGINHRFETKVYTTGTLLNGVLEGDLIIEGSEDPLFVWEEAIALGNALHQLGIKSISGDVIIVNDFYMNFKTDPQVTGQWLLFALNESQWTPLIEQAYQNLPLSTPRPKITVEGTIQLQSSVPPTAQLRLRHQSLTTAELLKQMNIYSNNAMAEMLAQSVGGASVVAQTAAKAANLDPQAIQLINGSGLGVENRISPYATCQMLMAIADKLATNPITVADIFPVAGRDLQGTMQWRDIPDGVAVKTGTLAQVSALAGVIPTKERGLVCFSLINAGNDIVQFRAEQDRFLQRLAQHWQIQPEVTLNSPANSAFLGDPKRNLLVSSAVTP